MNDTRKNINGVDFIFRQSPWSGHFEVLARSVSDLDGIPDKDYKTIAENVESIEQAEHIAVSFSA